MGTSEAWRVAAAQDLLDTHLPRNESDIGRCPTCRITGCGPYEIATAVFAGLGALPRRRRLATQPSQSSTTTTRERTPQ